MLENDWLKVYKLHALDFQTFKDIRKKRIIIEFGIKLKTRSEAPRFIILYVGRNRKK